MNISEAAKLTGLSAKTIRYYEQEGVITAASRAENGYRVYGPDHLRQMSFIKRARDLGFTLHESRELLDLAENNQRRSAEVKARVLQKLEWIDQQARQLERMRTLLLTVASECPGDDSTECPILDELYGTHR